MNKKYSYNSFAEFGKAFREGETDKDFNKAVADNEQKAKSKRIANTMSTIGQKPDNILKYMKRGA
jgi:hypothetical protein|tara:strand:+ start:103 stop:297 length:195 start_codon:yes stop_codon:yes gene_type:complete